jgi:hypothetical protein
MIDDLGRSAHVLCGIGRQLYGSEQSFVVEIPDSSFPFHGGSPNDRSWPEGDWQVWGDRDTGADIRIRRT